MRPRTFLAGLMALVWSTTALAAGPSGVEAPSDGDLFASLAARAEAEDPSLDFRALRLAWLDSAQKKRAPEPIDLQQKLNAAIQAGDHQQVRDVARQILASNYVDLFGHLRLRQACDKLGDKACSDHEKLVEFGLLNSITTRGNGQTFETAWPVVSIEEEYFILGMLGLKLKQQSLVNHDGRPYDVMLMTKAEGSEVTYYFDISAFFGRELE